VISFLVLYMTSRMMNMIGPDNRCRFDNNYQNLIVGNTPGEPYIIKTTINAKEKVTIVAPNITFESPNELCWCETFSNGAGMTEAKRYRKLVTDLELDNVQREKEDLEKRVAILEDKLQHMIHYFELKDENFS